MKPRYRKKGNFADGGQKIVIEYSEKDKLRVFTLPKAEILLSVLKRTRKLKEKESVKNRALTEPKVNK